MYMLPKLAAVALAAMLGANVAFAQEPKPQEPQSGMMQDEGMMPMMGMMRQMSEMMETCNTMMQAQIKQPSPVPPARP